MRVALKSLRSFVIAGSPARLAIHQSVIAQPNVDDRLAQNTIFFARAIRFGLLALCAFEFCRTGTGTHAVNVLPASEDWNVTQVTDSEYRVLMQDA